MNTIIKPIMALIFMMGLLIFIDYVSIFISKQNIDFYLEDSMQIIYQYDGLTKDAMLEIENTIPSKYTFECNTCGDLEVGESDVYTIYYDYKHILSNDIITISSSSTYVGAY